MSIEIFSQIEQNNNGSLWRTEKSTYLMNVFERHKKFSEESQNVDDNENTLDDLPLQGPKKM